MLYSPSAGSAIVTVMNDTPSVTASEPVRSDRSDRSASPTRRPSHRASRRAVAITAILASTVVASLFVNGPSASAATNAQAPDIVAGANTRLRFAGSNIQCVVAEFCANETHIEGFDLPDPIAMAYAIDGNIATEVREMYLAVETNSPHTLGMVVMDTLGITHHKPNAKVVTSADADLFMSMLVAAVT